jgi:hypothetical protein
VSLGSWGQEGLQTESGEEKVVECVLGGEIRGNFPDRVFVIRGELVCGEWRSGNVR